MRHDIHSVVLHYLLQGVVALHNGRHVFKAKLIFVLVPFQGELDIVSALADALQIVTLGPCENGVNFLRVGLGAVGV